MLLTLHPAPTAQRPAVAAFLAGAEPLAWLRELSRWNVAPGALACYVVPESVQSVRPAGLLVLLPAGSPPPPHLREPLGVVAGRLYLPTHATLRPATPAAELPGRLLYEVQLLHPAVGLVGFEATDCLALADLLALPPPQPADWSRAHPGAPLPPPLRSIRVQAPSVAEVLAEAQAEVGSAPLTELPGAPETPSPLEKTLNSLKQSALRAGLAASQGLLGALGGLGAGLAPLGGAGAGGATGPGPLDRLHDYFSGSLAELERKRNDELARLLELFGQNMEAALRFAIPLSSPYQHRGTAAPGSSLGAHSTNFSLGGLGGGQRVDGWGLSTYEERLRKSYLAAAAQEVAAGRFQKAAYIHAHLLGDYRTAAQVLVQGRYFREAAALYREHLSEPHTAATTLEQGGLLAEALEIYQELNAYEKVGDLYCALGQPARAVPYYERAAAMAQAANNLLAAAHILATKLLRPAEAETLLLAGWAGLRKPAAHLKQYLLLLSATRPADLPAAVRTLAQRHTPPGRRVQLLEGLLASLPTRLTDPALHAEVQQLGFEIISQEAGAGRTQNLHLLKKLLPHDRLLPGDASRYAAQRTFSN
ncbi:hypothetical protein QMK33_05735 [Hymenobacter sp. H14-R3]|uniref:hypothetical protein n=1 Tax=Hymenobacter sp. H14-R3 TaxID=3046308 RepID=UPI0024B9796C|nr:hypothetical protein [Hymenobacter sp. H14-R3]MDJ0364646.1 hypothetical protein [Hymenobacter sp. H14-R3]